MAKTYTLNLSGFVGNPSDQPSGQQDLLQQHLNDTTAHMSGPEHELLNTLQLGNGNMDVTSFEVTANSSIIQPGASELLGDNVTVAIPVQMTERFKVRSVANKDKIDVVIDWGDGTTSNLADGEFEKQTLDDVDEYSYTVAHTYEADGTYKVTIYGREYFGISHSMDSKTVIDPSHVGTACNLMSRAFGPGLNIASCVDNISSYARGAVRMLNVNAYGMSIKHIANMAFCFQDCTNLLTVRGFRYNKVVTRAAMGMFLGCINMTSCDMTIPAYVGYDVAVERMFENCNKLAVSVAQLVPDVGINVKSLKMTNIFMNCAQLTAPVPSELLFDDASVSWKNTTNAFKGCADAVKSLVPTTWGGTKQ